MLRVVLHLFDPLYANTLTPSTIYEKNTPLTHSESAWQVICNDISKKKRLNLVFL